MRWPTIKQVARGLRNISQHTVCVDEDEGCPVRLQVYPNGQWALRWGDPQYDQDHQGYWGSSSVPGVVNGRVKIFNSEAMAKDLISQCKDQMAEDAALDESEETYTHER